jgi:hypothetical protein
MKIENKSIFHINLGFDKGETKVNMGFSVGIERGL